MITVKNTGGVTQLYISGDIVDDMWRDWYWGDDISTYPEDIRTLLDDAKGDVEVIINSFGGDLFAGVAISNILRRYNRGKTTAIIDGLAASAASVIAFGCDEIEIPANGYLMIHKPWTACAGNADDLLHMAETLDELQLGIVNTYLTKAKEGITRDQINQMVDAETWMTGATATQYFKVRTTKEEAILNMASGSVYNYRKTPEEILSEEKLSDEIDVALQMY